MKRFALFVGIGGISTLLQFLLLVLFVESQLLPEVIASAAGYVLSTGRITITPSRALAATHKLSQSTCLPLP
jgi:hypothetical protein